MMLRNYGLSFIIIVRLIESVVDPGKGDIDKFVAFLAHSF